jgi:hypothetical protein
MLPREKEIESGGLEIETNRQRPLPFGEGRTGVEKHKRLSFRPGRSRNVWANTPACAHGMASLPGTTLIFPRRLEFESAHESLIKEKVQFSLTQTEKS